jgi:translation initiation factor 1A
MVEQFSSVGGYAGEAEEGGVVRVRLPRGKEVVGMIEELLGASRFRVKCNDGRIRLCRIPGKFRKRIRLRVGDVVLVEPWTVESEDKGDVVWIYNKTHAAWLRKKGTI